MFNTIKRFGEFKHAKSNGAESVFVVSEVDIITDRGANKGATSKRIDVREWVDNPRTGYDGPTKVGFMLDSEEQLDDLIELLSAIRDELQDHGKSLGSQKSAPPAPAPRQKRRVAQKVNG